MSNYNSLLILRDIIIVLKKILKEKQKEKILGFHFIKFVDEIDEAISESIENHL